MLRFIDIPEHKSLEHYETAIEAMVKRLGELKGVKSIYQIGSVSNPGISDIDMMIVFDHNSKQSIDPVRDVPTDQYLFTHQLYGVTDATWEDLRRLTFFHNYKHLQGDVMPELPVHLSAEEEKALKRQIALEFLVKMYIVLTVQLHYRIIKLRSFLLEGKALIYDLEFLEIKEGRFHELVEQIITWRANWFETAPKDVEIEKLIRELYAELEKLLREQLSVSPLFIPDTTKKGIAKNITLQTGAFSVSRNGIRFPDFGLLPARKHFNLLHRFNSFAFKMPMENSGKGDINEQRFDLLKTLRAYNQTHLPGYLVPASSLRLI